LLNSCTQAPAPVENLGEQFFGSEHQSQPYHRASAVSTQEVFEPQIVKPTVKTRALEPIMEAEAQPELKPQKQIEEKDEDGAEEVLVKPKPVAAAKIASPATPQFIWPAEGEITKPFGKATDGTKNDGINIALPEGSHINAAADGIVVFRGDAKAYGNLTLIKHENGVVSAYGNQQDILVEKGDLVKQGQLIGHVGKTGNATDAQLHFAVRVNKKPVDPSLYLP
jgi:murein DD-endopeptidase MepM/ murein hydrolase activator NlpD